MPIATINPATGETVKTFTPATDDEVDAAIARAHERFLDYRHSTTFAQRAEWANATADLLEAEADADRRDDDPGDGQDAGLGQGRSGQVRQGFSLLRRERRAAAGRRAGRRVEGRREEGLHPLPAARGGAGRDAVELPALAGRPVRRAGADGRQRRHPQARVERAAVRAVSRRRHRPRRLPGGLLPDAAGSVERRGDASCAIRGSRRPRSPAANRPASPSAPSPATRSSPPCSNSAAATRSS